jgi:excisionase family DNA binding protein
MSIETATAKPYKPALTLDDLRAEGVTISVERASMYLGVSKVYAYQIVKDGRLPTTELGVRRVRVPTAALLKMVDAA